MRQFTLTGAVSLLVLSGLALAGQSVEKQKQTELKMLEECNALLESQSESKQETQRK
jgi:hypothetical protein